MAESTENKPQSRRSLKNIFVDMPMQSRLAMNIVLVNFVVALIGLSVMLRNISVLRAAVEETPGLSETGSTPLANALTAIVATSFILVIISAAVNYIAGFYLAHRFAGPTKIITNYIDDLIAGNKASKRELRPNDELKVILSKLNELNEKTNITPK